MYVITNRQVHAGRDGLKKFGSRVNAKGPNELRLARVEKKNREWHVQFLRDQLTRTEARSLIQKHSLPLNPAKPHYASLKVACEVAALARRQKSHVLLFVHGFNNDMADVLERAMDLQRRYKVVVVPFSWPANGGGISGAASYRADKRDARASAGALERALQFVNRYLEMITEARRTDLYAMCMEKHPDNLESRNTLYAALLEKDCALTVNAMFHSMGNYLLKQMLKSSIAEGTGLTFDNILLVAADANNLDHDLWVERLSFRKRCFITINENDHALAASRAKSGSDQLARLGHYVRSLDASNAHYINFTDAPWVRNSHAYFAGPSRKNDKVFAFFKLAFSGEAAEDALRFHPQGNWFGF